MFEIDSEIVQISLDFGGATSSLLSVLYMAVAIAAGYKDNPNWRRNLWLITSVLESAIFILIVGLLVFFGALLSTISTTAGMLIAFFVFIFLFLILLIWAWNYFIAWLGWVIGVAFRPKPIAPIKVEEEKKTEPE